MGSRGEADCRKGGRQADQEAGQGQGQASGFPDADAVSADSCTRWWSRCTATPGAAHCDSERAAADSTLGCNGQRSIAAWSRSTTLATELAFVFVFQFFQLVILLR